MKRPTTSVFRSQPAPPIKKTNPFYMIGVILLFILLVLHNVIGALSINFFTVIDHLLKVYDSVSPIFMWGIMGILFGSVAGSFAVWKKYKLAFKWNLISIGSLILFIIVLIALSSPLEVFVSKSKIETSEATDLIRVSSEWFLPSYKTHRYDASNLIDADRNTAWMFIHEDRREESVSYLFTNEKMNKLEHVKVNGIRLMNGFNKSHSKWNSFNRVREFAVYHNGKNVFEGTASDFYNLDETFDFSPIELSSGDTVRINIKSVYQVNKKNKIAAVSKMIPTVTFNRVE